MQRLRIERAKRRFEHGSASIENIADFVGYRDVAYFRQTFKQMAGMTPNAYRAKVKIAVPGNGKQDRVAT